MERDCQDRFYATGDAQNYVDKYDRKRNAAIDQINEFCVRNHLLKKFADELADKLFEEDGYINPNTWGDEQFDKKVNEQLLKSITNFVNYLLKNQALRIKVSNGELNFQRQIRHGRDIGYQKIPIMRIKTLQQTIFTHFDQKKYHPKHIPNKIQQIFQKLFESLSIFLNKNYQNFKKSLGIYQIDYLLFSPIQPADQWENHNFINIGGLTECCFRFFRVLFQFLFSQSENFLLTDVRKRTGQFCQNDQIFIGRFLDEIQNKLAQTRDFEQSYFALINKNIEKQMKEFQYQKVLNHFIQNAAKIGQQRNIYEESSKIYHCQKILSKISRPQVIDTTVIVEQFCKPSISKICIDGIIEHTRKKQENEYFIDLSLLARRNSKFLTYFPQFNANKLRTQKVVNASHGETQIQIQRSGFFKIITEDSEQSYHEQVIALIKDIYPRHNVREVTERRYILTAYLGLKNLCLEQLANLPQFAGKVDLSTSQRLNFINEMKKANRVKNRQQLKAVSSLRNPRKQYYARKVSQQLPNVNYEIKEKFQIKFIIYNFSKICWDQNIHDTYEQLMFMTITNQGQVKIYNVTDFLYAEEEFMKVQKLIRNNYNKKQQIKK